MAVVGGVMINALKVISKRLTKCFILVLAFSACWSLTAMAATYSLPDGALPSGCTKKGSNKINCSSVNLGLDDEVNVTKSVQWNISGNAFFNSRVKINQSGNASSLTIDVKGNLTTETDVRLVANISVDGSVTLKDRTNLTGNLNADQNITLESGVVVSGNVTALKDIVVKSAGTIAGNINSINENVTLEAGSRISGNVSARKKVELKSNVQISGNVNPGKQLNKADEVIIESGSYVTGSVTADKITNKQIGSIGGVASCNSSDGSNPVSCGSSGGTSGNCPAPQTGGSSLAGKVIVNEMSFHGDTANGDWFELYVNDGTHNLQNWKVTLRGSGGINQVITLPNVTIPWSSAPNGRFIIFAASTSHSAIQAAISKGILQQNVNLFINPNIALHNTLQEILITDASNNLVYYVGYANNQSQANNFVYSCADDYPAFADTVIKSGNDDTACTTTDGVSSGTLPSDWSAGCNGGESTVGYSNAGDSVTAIIPKYRAEHLTTGTVGQPVNVTVKACLSDDCSSLLPGAVIGQIAIQSGNAALSQTSLSFNGGQTTLQLTPSAAGTVVFALSSMQVAAGSALSPASPVCLNTANSASSGCQVTVAAAEQCFVENFANTNNWYQTNLNSTPPSLQSSPSRLRLTTDAQNQSTSITFKRSFPASGNRLTVEFDHYAYGGNGADGISLVLSDATQVPFPGSYGGSLGYAQRNNGNQGFRGGWLGVGFDEYGNYSLDSEGRVGGIGGSLRPNAIGVRGASSTNYNWLIGTNSPLSPTLQNGASFGRGDRYRITIDSTVSSAPILKLERKVSEQTSYVSLINNQNLQTLGQPAPPANLLLSFTGSTGSNTNFHEITNVQVCSVLPSVPIEIGNPIHHFRFSYSAGVTCQSNSIEVRACLNADCSQLYTQPVSVTLSASNSGSWPGDSTINLNNGVGTLALAKTETGLSVISLASSSVLPANPVQCRDTGTADANCDVRFNNTALRFSTIANQVAGIWSSENNKLQIIETVAETGACAARVASSATVGLAYQCVNPTTCIAGQQLRIQDTSISPTTNVGIQANNTGPNWLYQNAVLSFAAAESDFSLMYSDVGRLQLKARLDLTATANQPAISLEALSNEFVVRPYQINAVAAHASGSPTNVNPSTQQTGAGFIASGDPFDLYVQVLNANGQITPNFGNEQTPEQISLSYGLAYPASGLVGTITGNALTRLSTGSYSGSWLGQNLTWDEVGSLSLSAAVLDEDYLGAGAGAAQTSVPYLLGRFYPAEIRHLSSTTVNACTNFTYMDQPGISLSYMLQAVNRSGQRTHNYGVGYQNKYKLTLVAENMDNGVNFVSRMEPARLSVGNSEWVLGENSLVLANQVFSKPSPLIPADGPFTQLQLGLALDANGSADLIALAAANMNAITPGNCAGDTSCNAVKVGNPIHVRYGRLQLENVYGPEDISLPVLLTAQYWDSTSQRFVRNVDDSCTSVSSSQLDVTGVVSSATGSGTLTNGQNLPGTILLPVSGVAGTASLTYQLLTPPAALPYYLGFPWSGGTNNENPKAEAVFGRYRGNKRQIFWQEKLN